MEVLTQIVKNQDIDDGSSISACSGRPAFGSSMSKSKFQASTSIDHSNKEFDDIIPT